ncbi:MAG: hypothetical protein MUE61_08305 [Vicinamibacterales bacterium]|nr:hypothetical protein [Vicinamibacterales bacterium]MCU0477167.1 hypothetical protein [Chloroflexota bacterium]MCU0562311.1 hypothetical protein [Desulfobacterales bacterium]
MPRFVRPAWIALDIDGRRTELAGGPTTRGGWIAGRVTLRTAAGGVSEPVRIAAGGLPARLEIDVPQGWTVAAYPGPTDDYAGRRSFTIRPPDDA